MIKTISREVLAARVQSGTAPVLLEALPERYFVQKHLPGARLFPHDQVADLAPRLLPDLAAPIVVYCASRTCQNSHIAAQRLTQLGYSDVSVYAGGKQDWEEGGLPFEVSEVTTA
jgi:rhodanese-related sulfurtransferase